MLIIMNEVDIQVRTEVSRAGAAASARDPEGGDRGAGPAQGDGRERPAGRTV